jgi:hypothetical protein
MTERADLAASNPSPAAPVAPPASKHVVLLVHGINTTGLWINTVTPVLNKAALIAAPCGYDVYGIVRFLLPFDWLRRKAIERVRVLINAAIEVHKPDRVSVIAHSFGSYIVARLVAQEFQQKWHRIIFCGSVNEARFPFEQLLGRFETPIINEVASNDALPAIAQRVTWGYGSIGSHGALSAIFKERWHNGLGHSDFLNAEFCEKFWIPWLRDGVIVEGDARPQPLPLWARLLVRLPLRWIAVALLAVLAYLAVGFVYSFVREPMPSYSYRYEQPLSTEWPVSDLNVSIGLIVDKMESNCRLGRFGRWWQGQTCLAIETGPDVSRLKACQPFDYRVRRPEEALRLAAAQFNCLDVRESPDSMSVQVRPSTTEAWQNREGSWLLCGCSADEVERLRAAR